jgi:hypothetical protein
MSIFGIGPFTLGKWGVILYILAIIIKNSQLKNLGQTLIILAIAWYILEMII